MQSTIKYSTNTVLAITLTNINVQNLVSQHKTNFDLPLNNFASWLKLFQWIRMYIV